MGNPVDFLCNASDISLDEFMLVKLNQAANLRKGMKQALQMLQHAVEGLVEAESEAKMATYLREMRKRGLKGSTLDVTR